MTTVRVSDLGKRQTREIMIHRDTNDPTRVFRCFPPYASMTPAEAIAVANALADTLEGVS